MNVFSRSAGRYAFLIIILFAIVAVAAHYIIATLVETLSRPANDQLVRELTIAVLALTTGCMFLAGGLGLWAIRSASEIESRRRVGRFVDAMDYLSDGLAALDRTGWLTGSNPALRRLAAMDWSGPGRQNLREIFPCLAAEDLACLLDFRRPHEIERSQAGAAGWRALRFRSQPSEGLMLVLVSDVTETRARENRQRQVAQLHLIGRIAAGVAHDFNNLLCSISGHAELLLRGVQDGRSAARIIVDESARGAFLSRQLLDLSRSGGAGPEEPGAELARHVADAAALLKVALAAPWQVEAQAAGEYPAVPLSGAQVEQVVLNLGLLAADARAVPGRVLISLQRPGAGPLLDVGLQFAAVIIVSGGDLPAEVPAAAQPAGPDEETGVILSVVRSMVEQAQGRVDQLCSPAGICVYRVCLPRLDLAGAPPEVAAADAALASQVAGRQVLLGGVGPGPDRLQARLAAGGAAVTRQQTAGALLGGMGPEPGPEIVIVDASLLEPDVAGGLQAIVRLCPRAGLVALGSPPAGLRSRAVFLSMDSESEALAGALRAARAAVSAGAPLV